DRMCPALDGGDYIFVKDVSARAFKSIMELWRTLSLSEKVFKQAWAHAFRLCGSPRFPEKRMRSLNSALFASHYEFDIIDLSRYQRDGAYQLFIVGRFAGGGYVLNFVTTDSGLALACVMDGRGIP